MLKKVRIITFKIQVNRKTKKVNLEKKYIIVKIFLRKVNQLLLSKVTTRISKIEKKYQFFQKSKIIIRI